MEMSMGGGIHKGRPRSGGEGVAKSGQTRTRGGGVWPKWTSFFYPTSIMGLKHYATTNVIDFFRNQEGNNPLSA